MRIRELVQNLLPRRKLTVIEADELLHGLGLSIQDRMAIKNRLLERRMMDVGKVRTFDKRYYAEPVTSWGFWGEARKYIYSQQKIEEQK